MNGFQLKLKLEKLSIYIIHVHFCMQKLSNIPKTKMYSFLLFSFNIKCTPDCTMKRRTEHRIDRYTYNKIYCSLFFHLVKYTQNCYMKAHMHIHIHTFCLSNNNKMHVRNIMRTNQDGSWL